jgi:hypothetical protein
VTKEEPLLIDPAADNPAIHLAFHQEFYRPMPSSRRGQATIDAFGLNEVARAEHRWDVLAVLVQLKRLRPHLAEAVATDPTSRELAARLADLDSLIAARQSDTAEYAAMARAVFR